MDNLTPTTPPERSPEWSHSSGAPWSWTPSHPFHLEVVMRESDSSASPWLSLILFKFLYLNWPPYWDIPQTWVGMGL